MGQGSSQELEVLYSHDQGTPTELDSISHQFIIDIARPSEPFETFLKNLKADLATGRFADQIGDQLDYENELSEMALPHVNQVVS